ncbi:MAG: enoyl-CoA hydratase/isomerase family protein [Chloroflexota bacterium]
MTRPRQYHSLLGLLARALVRMMTVPEHEPVFGDGVVLLARREGIATIVLNRPGQHNALSSATWQGLGDAVRAADADPSINVLVLRGAGQRAFSAGADIEEFETNRADRSRPQPASGEGRCFRCTCPVVGQRQQSVRMRIKPPEGRRRQDRPIYCAL